MPPLENKRVLITGFGPFRQTVRNPSWDCAIRVSDSLNEVGLTCDRAFIPTEYAAVIDRIPALHGVVSAPANLWKDREWRRREIYAAQFAQETWPGRTTIPYDLVVHVGQGLYDRIAVETVAHRRGYKALDNAGELPPVQKGSTIKLEEAAHEQVLTTRETEETTDRGYPAKTASEVLFGHVGDEIINRLDSEHVRKSANAGRFLCEFLFYASLAEIEQARSPSKCVFIHVPPYDDREISIDESERIVRQVIELALRS